ncbi:helix-turn-helix transcriptional regulator [Polynucleobacter rarus]|uniref:helix-turn-helix transcriptional regulator n=1 Tax=Polynucleobacter rarus TaxID=556055 RepID=UPI000D3E2645|nr:AlpA family phage regulatory protein [Polynucleobacter rarus]
MNPLQFDRIVRMRELKKLIGLSNATIYRYIKRNEFPRPFQISANCVGWRLSVVEDWIKARENQRPS